jgi:hypothetical protein
MQRVTDGAVSGVTFDDLVFRVEATERLAPDDERQALALFARSYREADLDYMRAAMQRLRTIALACHADRLVGFSLADTRRIDLPRLPDQVVRLAGLACVAPEFRRRHLMVELSRRTMRRDPLDDPGLVCGRMAHPATFRLMMQLPTAVPRIGVPPTAWQREIGQAVADAYGAREFDPDTFVCRGRGRPIGYPLIEIDATPDEWAHFNAVDRARGDSLLGFAWLRNPPPGW